MAELGRLIAEGDFPHSMEFYSNWFALIGTGYVVEGTGNECKPSVTGKENRTVQVEAGEIGIEFGNRYVRDTADCITLEPNYSDYDRYDVIYLQIDGTDGWKIFDNLAVVQGVPSEEPKHPDIPLPSTKKIVPICVVYWQSHSDEITRLKDCRTVMHDWMKDTAGTLHRWEPTGRNSSLDDRGIAFRPEVSPDKGEPILSVLNAEGSPRLIIEEKGVLGTSNPEIRTDVLEDGTGGNIVCDEGNLGNGLEYSSEAFQVELDLLDLKDTPSSYTGSGSKLLAVRNDESGLTFAEDSAPDAFLGLEDTPSGYTDCSEKVLTVKSDETGIEFNDLENGIDELTELDDTPSQYDGEAGKILKVKETEDGMEFSEITEESGVPLKKQLLLDDSFRYIFNFDELPGDSHDMSTLNLYGSSGYVRFYSAEGYLEFQEGNNGIKKRFTNEHSISKNRAKMTFSKQQMFRTVIEVEDVNDGRFSAVRGRATYGYERGFGFIIEDGEIKALSKNSNGRYTIKLQDISNKQAVELMVELFPNEKLEYYLDGELVHTYTDTTYIPTYREDFVADKVMNLFHRASNSKAWMTYYEFWMEA